MNPCKDWRFNQLTEDRDHAGIRLPTKDSVDYGNGRGNGRTVYFANGKPQTWANTRTDPPVMLPQLFRIAMYCNSFFKSAIQTFSV
jgi:hypothetical protein